MSLLHNNFGEPDQHTTFTESPDERTKGTLILCPCPGVDLPKLV